MIANNRTLSISEPNTKGGRTSNLGVAGLEGAMSFQRMQNGHTETSIGEKINNYFDQRELPMYKDKPYSYSATRRVAPFYRRWRFVGGVLLTVLILIHWSGLVSFSSNRGNNRGKDKGPWSWLAKSDTSSSLWDKRREKVKEAFMLSWDGYEQYAWGFDTYHPLSKNGGQMNDKGKGVGWIIVDALDTLMIMNLTSRLSHAREWISTSLNYDQDINMSTFETTIRMLGGLLSAHYLSNEFPDMAPLSDDDKGAPGEDLYLEKAADLADRLLGAFDSESGVPYASVNLKMAKGIASHTDAGASSTAEASSLQLEFKYLAYLTGEKNYWDKVEKVMEVIDNNGMEDGLLPIYIYATTGTFRGDNIRLGSRGDSYYEYLIKQYLQTAGEEPIYQDMWNQSLAGVRKHLITYSSPSHFTVLAERPQGLGGAISPKMDHLVCFMPGTIALGVTGGMTIEEAKKAGIWGKHEESQMRLATELTKTCWGMYKVMATGLAPEITHFRISNPPHMESDGPLDSADLTDEPRAQWRGDYDIKHNDNHNLQRPETVESLFYMWRITGNPMYREWGWEMFKNFVKYTAADDGAGFTSLAHANEIPPILKDNMESFWLAETLKYFYLLFSPKDLLPLDSIVINTEAHIFPRFKLARGLKTGWERKPRDQQGHIIQAPKQAASVGVQTETVKVEETANTASANGHGGGI
ncbi:MAG: hypothetical protein Q9163_005341 [Psora crenata]